MLAAKVNEQKLFELLTNNFDLTDEPELLALCEIRKLKPGTPILVCDGQIGYFESFEETEQGDCMLWFTDEGLYKGPDGEYYDKETNELVTEYIGNCSLGEYHGKA